MNSGVPELLCYETETNRTRVVRLDCDYVTDDVTDLIMMWDLNERNNAINQCLSVSNKPRAKGILENEENFWNINEKI